MTYLNNYTISCGKVTIYFGGKKYHISEAVEVLIIIQIYIQVGLPDEKKECRNSGGDFGGNRDGWITLEQHKVRFVLYGYINMSIF